MNVLHKASVCWTLRNNPCIVIYTAHLLDVTRQLDVVCDTSLAQEGERADGTERPGCACTHLFGGGKR